MTHDFVPPDPFPVPLRPRVHPWIPLLRVDGDRVLVGAGAPAALPARDSVAARAAAAAADGRATWQELAADPVLERGLRILAHHGALVDTTSSTGSSTWPAAQRERLERARLSQLASGDPAAAVTVSRRSAVPVRVFGPADLAGQAAQVMTRCGLDAAPTGPRTGPADDVVAVGVGRISWSRVREWTAAGVTHLAISPRADSVRVGPLVVPGSSACLQCLHLARRDRRPHWRSVSAQLPRTAVPRPDPMLLEQAWALAARCLVAQLQQGSSPAHNAYWEVRLTDLSPRLVDVARHPLCGCWWPRPPDSPDWSFAASGSPGDPEPE